MYIKQTKKISIISTIVLLFCVFASTAQQTRINSPYTRYGLGDISFANYNKNFGMGSVSTAYLSPHAINYTNPASYAAFDSLSFLFDASLYMNQTELTTTSSGFKSQYSSLGSVVAGFPVNKWCKVSFGLLPYSSVGYNIQSNQYKALLDTAYNTYDGDGGLNMIYFGSGFKIMKNLYVGANINYIYGNINRNSSVTFLKANPDGYNIIKDYNTNVKDFFLTLGTQYIQQINKTDNLVFGVTYSPSRALRSNLENTTYIFKGDDFSTSEVQDTVVLNNEKGKIVFPSVLTAGIAYQKANKIWTSIDFKMLNASEIKIFDIKDSLKDMVQIGWGFQFTPNSISKNYFKRMSYRVGARYNQTPYDLYGERVNEYGISFGIGLPLRKSKSTINFGFEMGERGKAVKGLAKEKFYKFVLNISMHERWFIKSKYD